MGQPNCSRLRTQGKTTSRHACIKPMKPADSTSLSKSKPTSSQHINPASSTNTPMKREGRQHGVVRSYPILPFDPLSLEHQTERRHVKTVDSALVKQGIFTKVSRKPTNQSKFTGKCGKAQCLGCHIHPATKSKDKTKGTMKMRSIGGSDHGRVGYPAGTSATGVLAHLAGDRSHDDDGSEDYDYGVTDDDCYYYYDDDNDVYDYDVETVIGLTANEEEEDVRSVKEDEYLSYCDVGLRWGDGDDLYVGDDGWYLVGHSQ